MHAMVHAIKYLNDEQQALVPLRAAAEERAVRASVHKEELHYQHALPELARYAHLYIHTLAINGQQ